MTVEVPHIPNKGRGAVSNRSGRFESLDRIATDDGWQGETELRPLRTTVGVDTAKTVIARNDSPDLGFDQSINAYRGCEHGCAYCYARPSHAFLGLSPGEDFESRLFAKPDAPARLAEELAKPSYRCKLIAIGTNTDCYQPVERRMAITRGILEVLQAHNHPVSIVTKSALVVRDIDILADMATRKLVKVSVSVTTLDRKLANKLEPRAATPERRLGTIRALSEAGIPTGVMVAPIIPALNDMEIEHILAAATQAGARECGYVMLRLPGEVKDLFGEWLAEYAPMKAQHVMGLVRDMRGGKSYDNRFGHRQRGTGAYAEMIRKRFALSARRHRYLSDPVKLDTTRFKRPSPQGDLFEDF